MNGTCSRSLVAVVLGTMLLLLPWGGIRAAEPPAAPAGDSRQKLVGEWELDLPELSVTYQFGQDGKFTLLFDRPIGGSAGGTWKVDGDALALDNTWTKSPYAVLGERETAKIVSVNDSTLVMTHEGPKGKDETLKFARVAPFAKGKADNPKVIGSWRANGQRDDLLVLGADGTAVFDHGTGTSVVAQWSQSGDRLLIRSPELAQSIRTILPTTNPADRRVATTQPGGRNILLPRSVSAEIILVDDATMTLRLPGRTDAITYLRLK